MAPDPPMFFLTILQALLLHACTFVAAKERPALAAHISDDGTVVSLSMRESGKVWLESRGLFFRSNGSIYVAGSPVDAPVPRQHGNRRKLELEGIQRNLKVLFTFLIGMDENTGVFFFFCKLDMFTYIIFEMCMLPK